ncbi:uncharacterized protein FYN12_014691 [Phoenicopterus ruber ruber]
MAAVDGRMAADSTEATARSLRPPQQPPARGEKEAEVASGGSWQSSWRRFRREANGMRESEERDAKIKECDTENGELTAEIGERHTKIRGNEAEIRRLTELLEDREWEVRKSIRVSRRSGKRDSLKRVVPVLALASEENCRKSWRSGRSRELKRAISKGTNSPKNLTKSLKNLGNAIKKSRNGPHGWENGMPKSKNATEKLTNSLQSLRNTEQKCVSVLFLALRSGKARGKEEEKMANVTLDPETAHPRLILSKDQKSVRWEYMLREFPDSPERFDADPCVLGCEAFTSGRHYWVVDLAEGQYCAVGVSKESLQRKGPISFNPEEGIWAVQQWGFKNRALTDPPTLLNLPRVPRKIRISLDYEWGEVAFFDVENKIPIFTFPPASFAGERIRPWFWVELGSLSLVR